MVQAEDKAEDAYQHSCHKQEMCRTRYTVKLKGVTRGRGGEEEEPQNHEFTIAQKPRLV